MVYGRTGSKLNFYRKQFSTELLACRYIDQRTKQKLNKGYVDKGTIKFDPSQLAFSI